MTIRDVSTIILGTGPAGLTAGLELAERGEKPILIERGKSAGGLMRSMRRGDFIVDIGRKQMYSRIPEIHDLWSRLLGDDYRPYERRVGILYKGHILESDSHVRGATLGMPAGLLLQCGADLLWGWVKGGAAPPKNHEEYWHRRRGRLFTQILTQGFEERFRGDLWRDMPPPDSASGGLGAILGGLKSKIDTARHSRDPVVPVEWRHPAKGTGQIVERLEQEIARHDGEILFQHDVVDLKRNGKRFTSLTCKLPSGESVEYRFQNLIASIPIELLARLVMPGHPLAQANAQGMPRRSAALVYLFLNGPPPFPHTFLEVSCPDMKTGRIANYGALGGDMVPRGKSCLCVEFFCDFDDPLMKLSEQELGDLAVRECTENKLLDKSTIADVWPLKFPGADAATDYRDWLTEDRRVLIGELSAFENLFFVNRAGADAASYAGMEAARAILSGSRTKFDRASDPRHSLKAG